MNVASMDLETLRQAVLAALAKAPGVDGTDLVESGRVRDLEVEDGGRVRFAFQLRPEDPGAWVKSARQAVEAVSGVSDVKVDVQLPKLGGASGPKAAPTGRGGGLKPGSVPAPTP